MKKLPIILVALGSALFFGGCVYEEGYTGVTVDRGGYYPGYYDDGGYAAADVSYDEGPYYFYGGRRYYFVDGRYRYYEGGRPIYVTRLPVFTRVKRPTTSQPSRGAAAVATFVASATCLLIFSTV